MGCEIVLAREPAVCVNLGRHLWSNKQHSSPRAPRSFSANSPDAQVQVLLCMVLLGNLSDLRIGEDHLDSPYRSIR